MLPSYLAPLRKKAHATCICLTLRRKSTTFKRPRPSSDRSLRRTRGTFLVKKIVYAVSIFSLTAVLSACSDTASLSSDELAFGKVVPGCAAKGKGVANNPHCQPTPSPTPTSEPVVWLRQFSPANSFSSQNQINDSVLDNAENIIAVGLTYSSFDNGPVINDDQGDAILIKYDKDGVKLWSLQFGTQGPSINVAGDSALTVDVDSQNNIYVAGHTFGSLDAPTAGPSDIFIRKYDPNGNLIWAKQFGTEYADRSTALEVDDVFGHVYLGGHTYGAFEGARDSVYGDSFLIKLDSSGTVYWKKQIGVSDQPDGLQSIKATNDGNVIVGGCTGSAGWCYGSISKYNNSGVLQFSKIVGGEVNSIALAPNGDIVVGGSLHSFEDPTIISSKAGMFARYDSAGNQLWKKHYGGISVDDIFSIALDSYGNGIGCGFTRKEAGGVAVIKVNHSSGDLVNVYESGAGTSHICTSVSLNSLNQIYISGSASVSLDGQAWTGVISGYIAKLSELIP